MNPEVRAVGFMIILLTPFGFRDPFWVSLWWCDPFWGVRDLSRRASASVVSQASRKLEEASLENARRLLEARETVQARRLTYTD